MRKTITLLCAVPFATVRCHSPLHSPLFVRCHSPLHSPPPLSFALSFVRCHSPAGFVRWHSCAVPVPLSGRAAGRCHSRHQITRAGIRAVPLPAEYQGRGVPGQCHSLPRSTRAVPGQCHSPPCMITQLLQFPDAGRSRTPAVPRRQCHPLPRIATSIAGCRALHVALTLVKEMTGMEHA